MTDSSKHNKYTEAILEIEKAGRTKQNNQTG